MKLHVPAIALFIGLTSAAVPMRSIASSQVEAESKKELITELIVEQLPGRSSLGAMSLIENEFDINAIVESKIIDRLEVIQLDQPITRTEADVLVRQLVDSGKVALAEINEKRYVATDPGDARLVTQCSEHHQEQTVLSTEQDLIADLTGWSMPLIQDRHLVERYDS
jgi:hypothetical protein